MSDHGHWRPLRWLRFQLKRLLVAAMVVVLAVWLAHRLGPWFAILLVAPITLLLCMSMAWMLFQVKAGQVTRINHLAWAVLPFGARIGRGRLWPIVACSWAGWMIIATVAALYAGCGFSLLPRATEAAGRAPAAHAFLIVGLLVDLLAFGFLVRIAVERLSPRASGIRPMIKLWLILLATIFGSVALAWLGHPVAAALLAAAPPVIVGGFYGLFFLILVISKPKWN